MNNIDINGPLRIEKIDGTIYVIGDGLIIPAFSRREARQILRDLLD